MTNRMIPANLPTPVKKAILSTAIGLLIGTTATIGLAAMHDPSSHIGARSGSLQSYTVPATAPLPAAHLDAYDADVTSCAAYTSIPNPCDPDSAN